MLNTERSSFKDTNMTDAKNKAKIPALGNFNWADTLKKADSEGTVQKTEPSQGKTAPGSKASSKPLSHKQNLTSPKAQMRLRRKV